jgi:hypothetical protein
MFLGIALTSCDKKNNPVDSADEQQFVGTWDLVGISSEDEQGNIYQVPPEEIEADPLTYVFRLDGSGTQFYKGILSDFTWNVQGDKFISTINGLSQEYTYSINSTTLSLTFKFIGDGPNELFTITHKFSRYTESIQAEFGILDRVPIFNSANPNHQNLTVTTTPSSLPAGETVTLQISTTLEMELLHSKMILLLRR